MQKAELKQRQQAIEERFAQLTREKENITQELYMLKGQHDLLGELIVNFKEGESSGSKSGRAKELTSKS